MYLSFSVGMEYFFTFQRITNPFMGSNNCVILEKKNAENLSAVLDILFSKARFSSHADSTLRLRFYQASNSLVSTVNNAVLYRCSIPFLVN
jgi:hypothetical protein